MYINTAKRVLAFASSEDGLTDDGTHYLLRGQRESSKSLLENRMLMPTSDDLSAAARHLSEITEIQFSAEQVESILSLYPSVRIALAVANGVGPTSVRDDLSFVAAHFFLGCSWPNYGDEIDVGAFVDLLKKQATMMGFVPVKEPA